MLEQFKHPYKYKIQFSSDTQIGYVNVITFGTKADAINLFYKHCRLKNPNVIDCKFIGVVLDYEGGGGEIGTLTFQVNGETVGTFDGEDKLIDITVPTKMSQLVNDASYITRDDISEELVEEIKQEIEQELGGEIETKSNKVQVISEHSTEEEYPSAKAVYEYIESCVMTEEDVQRIIEGNS
jgi:hypothetical protein